MGLPQAIEPRMPQGIEPRTACPNLPSFMANFDRIVGGQKAEAPIPWQVSLRVCPTGNCAETVGKYCGGSVLDSKTILSAAHCFQNTAEDYTTHFVMAGAVNMFDGQNIKIAQVRG